MIHLLIIYYYIVGVYFTFAIHMNYIQFNIISSFNFNITKISKLLHANNIVSTDVLNWIYNQLKRMSSTGSNNQPSETHLSEADRLKRQQRIHELQVLSDELKTVKSESRVYVQQRNSQVCFLDNISTVKARLDKELCSLDVGK